MLILAHNSSDDAVTRHSIGLWMYRNDVTIDRIGRVMVTTKWHGVL